MDSITLADAIDMASKVGVTSGLVLLLVAIIRGWLVPKYVLDDRTKERDDWKEIALGNQPLLEHGAKIADRGMSAAERAAELAVQAVLQRQAQQDHENKDRSLRDERDRTDRSEREGREERRRPRTRGDDSGAIK